MSEDAGMVGFMEALEAITSAINRGEVRGAMDCPRCKAPSGLKWLTANPHANKSKRQRAVRAKCESPNCLEMMS